VDREDGDRLRTRPSAVRPPLLRRGRSVAKALRADHALSGARPHAALDRRLAVGVGLLGRRLLRSGPHDQRVPHVCGRAADDLLSAARRTDRFHIRRARRPAPRVAATLVLELPPGSKHKDTRQCQRLLAGGPQPFHRTVNSYRWRWAIGSPGSFIWAPNWASPIASRMDRRPLTKSPERPGCTRRPSIA